ncbi:MAG: hypothetical protein L0177_20310 [Chloroflexi bacterium]|nr:hypothetical protein [Chloroflexota bacterium]
MAVETLDYTWTDAWLLLSVIYAGRAGEATLDRIIEAGDFINHAIFTHEELRTSLAKLGDGGLVEMTDAAFAPTEKTIQAYSSIAGAARTPVYKEIEALSRFLAVEPERGGALPDSSAAQINLSQQAYEDAARAYMRRSSLLKQRGNIAGA